MLHAMIATTAALLSPAESDARAKVVLAAAKAMQAGRPVDAIAMIDPALAAFDRQYAGEKRRLICTWGPHDTLAGLFGAAIDGGDAIAVKGDWCDALFIKGFSLVYLKRTGEGIPYLERAVAMARGHAHFLNELAYAYGTQRDWVRTAATYQHAADAAERGDRARRIEDKARALRGLGYALVEQGKWEEAEAAYREAVKLAPKDKRAPAELQYIAQHRPKPA